MIKISIKPEAVINELKNRFLISLVPLKRIAPFTLREFDKKKIKNRGIYIGIKSNVMGLNVRATIKPNR